MFQVVVSTEQAFHLLDWCWCITAFSSSLLSSSSRCSWLSCFFLILPFSCGIPATWSILLYIQMFISKGRHDRTAMTSKYSESVFCTRLGSILPFQLNRGVWPSLRITSARVHQILLDGWNDFFLLSVNNSYHLSVPSRPQRWEQ